MLSISYSQQYGTAVVVIDDLPADADEIIKLARDEGAIYDDEGETFVVSFPDGPGPELYTERALRASVRK